MTVDLKHFPVVIPPGFEPLELCCRGKKFCPGQEGPEYKPRWGGGFYAPRGPTKAAHRALDIMAAIGADVLAIDDGVVQERWVYKGQARPGAGVSPKGGYYVRIRHSWGVSYYAHLHGPPLVAPGDRVAAGQKLGFVGRSGNAKPGCPHLHLSIQVGAKLVDPTPLLKPLYDAGLWKGK